MHLKYIVIGLTISGCFSLDPGLYEMLEDQENFAAADACDDPDSLPELLGSRDFTVDTTDFSNSISASCVPGNDAFFTISGAAGDIWHLHVTSETNTRNPSFYFLTDCEDRSLCASETLANECTDSTDEHSAFVLPSTGKFVVGIDDGETGGGVYNIAAHNIKCNNGKKQHGENCDPSDETSTLICDPDICQPILQPSQDDPDFYPALGVPISTIPEAPILTGMQSGEVRFINNTVANGACTDRADIILIDVPDGAQLQVTAVDDKDGTPCTSDPNYQIGLNNSGSPEVPVVSRGAADASGCPSFTTGALNGRYRLRVYTGQPVQWFLKVEVL